MKSVEPPLIPVPAGPPTEEDLGFNLGASSADTGAIGFPRPWLKVGQLTFVWVLWSVLLAAASLYYVFTGTDASRLLAWTAAGAAVGLLLGAGLMRYARLDAAGLPPTRLSLLYLVGFSIPLGQFLFAMVHGHDPSATVLVLLLVVGYAVVAPSAESLLAFL